MARLKWSLTNRQDNIDSPHHVLNRGSQVPWLRGEMLQVKPANDEPDMITGTLLADFSAVSVQHVEEE
eukprot:CAMPEP_0184750500 /NCGR_PEP_ID=MMETSP0315-20130426/36799_1 /TAXON_ID=101924 /ORGANISM="Rhodosorus marinus, Strain UTEX LB 2760" /LENGTH=67 /DNA_ID=CAMNT_0027228773 /DNA_START=263 /DNA_END=463 /DNA_ORIENTATION=+